VVEALVVAARLGQFIAAAMLFGAPLFGFYALREPHRRPPWARNMVLMSAGAMLLATLTAILAQTAAMAGDPAAAFDRAALGMVLTGTAFGAAAITRVALSTIVLILAWRRNPGQPIWIAVTTCGAAILASLVWSGHGGADPGPMGLIHVLVDIAHLLAAGVWLGALAAFAALIARARRAADIADISTLHQALHGFSGVGALVVATLLASGVANSLFMLGATPISGLLDTTYGRVLIVKLVLFTSMLLFAAINRLELTPRLGTTLLDRGDPSPPLRHLAGSLVIETGLGLGVLALVSVLGTLTPPSALM
jgi:putative copper resistance protein D